MRGRYGGAPLEGVATNEVGARGRLSPLQNFKIFTLLQVRLAKVDFFYYIASV